MRDSYFFEDFTKNSKTNQNESLKPKNETIKNLLSFSKSLQVVKTKKSFIELVLN